LLVLIGLLFRCLDINAQIGVAQRISHHEINRLAGDSRELQNQIEEIASMLFGFDGLELDQQIQVAGVGIEVNAQCRARQMQPMHLELPAGRLDGLKL